MKHFSQFASDLDQATQSQLARGVRLRELLKQAQSSPLSVAEQVATIYTGINGFLAPIDPSDVREFLVGLREYIANKQVSLHFYY